MFLAILACFGVLAAERTPVPGTPLATLPIPGIGQLPTGETVPLPGISKSAWIRREVAFGTDAASELNWPAWLRTKVPGLTYVELAVRTRADGYWLTKHGYHASNSRAQVYVQMEIVGGVALATYVGWETGVPHRWRRDIRLSQSYAPQSLRFPKALDPAWIDAELAPGAPAPRDIDPHRGRLLALIEQVRIVGVSAEDLARLEAQKASVMDNLSIVCEHDRRACQAKTDMGGEVEVAFRTKADDVKRAALESKQPGRSEELAAFAAAGNYVGAAYGLWSTGQTVPNAWKDAAMQQLARGGFGVDALREALRQRLYTRSWAAGSDEHLAWLTTKGVIVPELPPRVVAVVTPSSRCAGAPNVAEAIPTGYPTSSDVVVRLDLSLTCDAAVEVRLDSETFSREIFTRSSTTTVNRCFGDAFADSSAPGCVETVTVPAQGTGEYETQSRAVYVRSAHVKYAGSLSSGAQSIVIDVESRGVDRAGSENELKGSWPVGLDRDAAEQIGKNAGLPELVRAAIDEQTLDEARRFERMGDTERALDRYVRYVRWGGSDPVAADFLHRTCGLSPGEVRNLLDSYVAAAR